MLMYTRLSAPMTPTESAPSLRMCGTGMTGLTPGRLSAPPAICSSSAVASRAATLNTALIVRGLLTLSEATNDVSSAPGGEELRICQMKLVSSGWAMKIRPIQKYWPPMVADRLSHSGALGSWGGLSGCALTWQKPQLMLSRYG